MARICTLAIAVLCLCFLDACSDYVDYFHYDPHPAIADLPATQPQQLPPLSALVSIIGVRYEDTQDHIPESVEVAMRLENNGPYTVVFDPQSMKMTNGTFAIFRPPLARPPAPITLAPGQLSIVNAFFPFPPDRSWDDIDMSWLQLSWLVQLNGQPVKQVANFQRIFRRYYYYNYDPYWGYPNVWVGGGVYVHRR